MEGELLHLWHGETVDRGYGKRYEVLAEFDFNLVLAAGATVAGVRSAVIAQNSGLGNLINPLTSLHMTYAIPVLVFMSLRGWPDPRRDEPQHAVMGASTHRLLDAIDVAHWTLNQDATSMVELLDAAEQELAAGRPAFILAEKGDKPHRQPLPGLVSQRRHRRAEHDRYGRRHGLAGLRPTVSGFASIVIGRAAEQIILSIAWPNLPVTIVGHYAGLSGALEGAPHHATTDLAFTRAIPGMRIWTPADDTDVGPIALSEEGPTYLRLCRDPVEPITGDQRIGDSLRVWATPSADVTIVACGVVVGEAVQAAEILNAGGIETAVVGVLLLKPFPKNELAGLIGDSALVVTVEEHNIIGGLGSSVAEVIASNHGPPTLRLGIADRFTETGPHRQLLAHYGLASREFATLIQAAWGRHK
ncbi:MAG: transketolase C-terminal domain-containing protein [Pseudonocardiaceae bacterium]